MYVVRHVGVIDHVENRFAGGFLPITGHQGGERIPQTQRGAFRPDQSPQVARKNLGIGYRFSEFDDFAGSDGKRCRVLVLTGWRVRMPEIVAALIDQDDDSAAFRKIVEEADLRIS